ncbi:DgyrCDS7637 [Dimorphilus gyrociliatus]|uniref:DgyrCDS7637 n=1 Tax=Dimorphilus gyrociliatus TaxID=2664684 RepID=A0A7I8VRL2_9ANNE|nr:DgyrCDS7637 [Dimorphilus gyrociliatus]
MKMQFHKDFIFFPAFIMEYTPAKHVRYKKCIEVGMSKTAIKIGRYSRERLKKNKEQLAILHQKRSSIPYLLNHSDAQDIILICNNSFSDFMTSDWRDSVEGLDDLFSISKKVIKEGMFNQNQYMDIYGATGVELDNRKVFFQFTEAYTLVAIKFYLKSLLKLPGMSELSKDDFFRIVLQNQDDFQLLDSIKNKMNWENNGVVINLKDQSLNIDKENISKLTDESVVQLHQDSVQSLANINLTMEEAIIITALDLFYPTKKHPHFKTTHDRLTVALSRYLECRYGNNSHQRLGQLMNFISNFKENSLNKRNIHYGAYTCEACKVFFSRSSKRNLQYKCKTGQHLCSPSRNCTFACSLCRYKKCLSLGMSRDSMQLGPYSRHKRIQNSKVIAELWRKSKLNVPHPLMHSDVDDILTLATTGFSEIRSVVWSQEISNFDQVFLDALKTQEFALIPKDYFMDFLEETGLELDDRKVLSHFSQQLLGYWYRRILAFARKLPGMSELSTKDFLLHMVKSTDLLYILMLATTAIYWNTDCLVINLNDKVFTLGKSKMVYLSDEKNVELHESIHKRLDNLKLTMEESLFIYALNLVSDSKQPQLKQAHSRMTSSFIRYLQSTNGGDYQKRLLDIVNSLAILKEKFYSDKKWFHYGVYTCEACKVFYGRSLKRSTPYQCKRGRNLCSPADNFLFKCSACRFNKCVKEGMSTKGIKIGPYTKKRREENLKFAEKLQSRKSTVYSMLSHSDADDIFIQTTNATTIFTNIVWSDEIHNFDLQFQNAQTSLENIYIPFNEYSDILEVTGLELDDRKGFLHFLETLFNIWYRYSLIFSRSLPGMTDLKLKDLISISFKNADMLYILDVMYPLFYLDKENIYFGFNDRILKIECERMKHVLDNQTVQVLTTLYYDIKEINLSKEEAVFLYSLHLVSGGEKPHFAELYNRILVSFIRYLKGIYTDKYETRLLRLTNFIAKIRVDLLEDKRWSIQHQKYLQYFFKDPLCQLFFYTAEPEDCIDKLSHLEI